MKALFFLAVVAFTGAPRVSAAEPSVFALSLVDAETKALASSPALAAADQERVAAEAQSRSAASGLFPHLGLDATARYQDVVPELPVGPAGARMPLGDNESYSYGPSLNWLLWDSGGTYRRWKSAQAQARAKRADADALRRATLLDVRLAYLTVQQATEQIRLLADSLKLNAAQYLDISVRQKEGAGSRLDTLSSHQELLSRERLLRQAQSELSVSLRTLLRLTNLTEGVDVTSPLPRSAVPVWPAAWEKPTLLVNIDSPAIARRRLTLPKDARLDAEHPAILSLAERARAAEEGAAAARSGWWPSLSASARISRDYPNGPIHETITQKTVGASASWSLFDAGRVSGESRSAESQAAAAGFRKEDRMRALDEEWASNNDRLRGLLQQETINRQAVEETDALVRITYRSYLSGGVNHLQVETANLRALESRVLQAQIESQIAFQLSVLSSLSTPGDRP